MSKLAVIAIGFIVVAAIVLVVTVLVNPQSSTDVVAIMFIPIYALVAIAVIVVADVTVRAVIAARDLRPDRRRIDT